jgi:hypothetical protein
MATGRPPHQPDPASRRLVEHHAAIGTLHQTIAKLLQISLNTMKKFYAEELELGLARANAVVSGTLFTEAKKGNITAAIFWMKTRGGWRETNKIEHSGGTSLEVRQLDATRLSKATLDELMAARTAAPARESEALADPPSASQRKLN